MVNYKTPTNVQIITIGTIMLINRISPNEYNIKITNGEAGQLTKLAIFYASCDCVSMLRTIIQDGIDLNQSILKLHEDSGYRKACQKKLRAIHQLNDNSDKAG